MLIRPDFFLTFDLARFAGPAMGIVFTLWLVVFILLGIILSFHWRQYSYNIFAAWLFTAGYFAVGIGLLTTMAIAQL